LKIVIPDGALDETKEIEIKKVKMKGAVGPAFQISPDIKFKIPAEISIKYENNSNNQNSAMRSFQLEILHQF